MKKQYLLDWNELAFGSKSELGEGTKTFIAAPRSMSQKRLQKIIRTYLPKGDLVIGVSKETYVENLEGLPQFEMIKLSEVEPLVSKIAESNVKYTCQILEYNQRDLMHILKKVRFQSAVFVNGSWYGPFHMKPIYYELMNSKTPYELISPFIDEIEASVYVDNLEPTMTQPPLGKVQTEEELLKIVSLAAQRSYDYAAFLTGAVLAKKSPKGYDVLMTSHNKILPYETYAMHTGSLREKNFAPQNDMNYYDTLHAEMVMLSQAAKSQLSLKGCTLFVNLLPCPQCARMLADSELQELVYSIDHSAGFAARLLEDCGKKVRRVLP